MTAKIAISKARVEHSQRVIPADPLKICLLHVQKTKEILYGLNVVYLM